MERWQLHERHDRDIRRILTETGCMDAQGRLRAWHGRTMLAALAEAGHDAVLFDQCSCCARVELLVLSDEVPHASR
jgi:hypothetical protein